MHIYPAILYLVFAYLRLISPSLTLQFAQENDPYALFPTA